MWQKASFIKFFFYLSIGIILARYSENNEQYLHWAFATIGLIILTYLLVYRFTVSGIDNNWRTMILGLCGIIFLILTGYSLSKSKQTNPDENIVGTDALSGTVVQTIARTPKKESYHIQLSNIRINNLWRPSNQKFLLNVYQPNNKKTIQVGYKIVCNAQLEKVVNKPVIGAFDAVSYFSNQNIFYTANTYDKPIILNTQNYWYVVKRYANLCSESIQRILEKNIDSEDEAAIAKALLIGVRTDMDYSLKQSYSNAGVVHLLAVSGLHVSILFFIITFFLRRLILYKYGNKAFVIIAIILLWFFAFITGLSTSVVRAVVMFSILLISILMERQNNTSNTVFLSAFMMLLFDPLYLFDVGFQLSYLAVLGIVWVHPWLNSLMVVKNKWLSKAWEACSVTLSAQLLTTPLCVYYFHKFPTYFLPANMLLISATNLAMVMLIVLIAVNWIPYIPQLIGYLVKLILLFCNKVVISIDSWLGSTIYIDGFDSFQTMAAYLVLLGIMLVIYKKQFIYLLLILLGCEMYGIARTRYYINQGKQMYAVVYASDEINLGYVQSKSLYILNKQRAFSIRTLNKLKEQGIGNISSLGSLNKGNTIIKIDNISIAIFGNFWEAKTWVNTKTRAKVDFMVVKDSSNYDKIFIMKNKSSEFKTNLSKALNLRYYKMNKHEIVMLSKL